MSCPTLPTTPVIPTARGPLTLVQCIGLFVYGSFLEPTVVGTETIPDLAVTNKLTESPLLLEIDVDTPCHKK